VFTDENYLSENINGVTANDRFVLLYTGDTTGQSYDATRVFWGDTAVAGVKTFAGYISLNINGTAYWIRVYSGNASAACCSNLVGTYATSGTFDFYGYVLVIVNNSDQRWLRIYTKE